MYTDGWLAEGWAPPPTGTDASTAMFVIFTQIVGFFIWR